MKGRYVITLVLILVVIYVLMPENTIHKNTTTATASAAEGFINVPTAKLDIPTQVKDSEPTGLLFAPFYEISEDRPRPPMTPDEQPVNIARLRRLLERLETFFMADYKHIEGKVEYLEPLTTAKAALARIREEIHFLDANPGMSPTVTIKYIMETEATLSFLERKSRLLIINDIASYSNFQNGISNKEGFTNPPPTTQTRAKVSDLVNFNIRAWAEVQRLGASGTNNPITVARIAAINNIRQSIQSIIDEVERKQITEEEIPVFKEEIEKAFPVLTDYSKPIPKIIMENKLPPELANLLPPGNEVTSERDASKLISLYISNIINNIPSALYKKEAFTNEIRDFIPHSDASNMNLTYSTPNGKTVDSVNVSASNADTQKTAKFMPTLDWKGRTRQICEQVRMRGMDPEDFGCMKNMNDVSADYSWRGHAKMVCSRLQATPDPALPETCGCPAENWPGWKSYIDIESTDY